MKERGLKTQTKCNANVVGADDSVCPQPVRNTQTKTPTKVSSNLNSHISHLTSDHNGITLIALIISIIIMIILVAVTVNIAINGKLFGTAKEAAYETEKAAMLEQIQVELAAKYAKGQGVITKEEVVSVLERYGVVAYDEEGEITGIVTSKGYGIDIGEMLIGSTEEVPEEPPVQEPDPIPPEPTDTESPTVQIATTETSPTNASTITYTITFSEDVTGFAKEDITVENGTAVTLNGSGRTYSVEVTNSGSGTQKVSIGANKCTDGAGNGNEASNEVNIVIDRDKPTVQIATTETNPTNASTITYTITFSEDVTGFAKEDITVENGTAVTLNGSGRTYSVEVTNSGSGTQKVSVGENVCTDGAGNGNEASNVVSIVIDRENPTVGISPNGGYYVMPTGEGETAKVSATLTSEKTGGSLATVQYAWSESNTEEPTSGWETFTNNQTVEKTGITEPSTWYLWTKVIDGVGNRGEVSAGKYVSNAYIIGANNITENMIKLTPNSTPATLTSSNGWTKDDVVVEVNFGANLSGEKTLSCTGTEGEDYEINGTHVAAQEISGLELNGTTSITVKTNNQTVTATAKDAGGNTSVATIKITHIDKTPAVIGSVLGVIESEETNGLVTFSLTAEDLESGLDNITWYYQSTETGSEEESITTEITENKTASNVEYTKEVQLEEGTTYNCYAVVNNMVGKTIRVPAGTDTVEITTSEPDDWSWLSKMAVEISKDDSIPGADVAEEPVMQVTKTIDGTEHTLNIGDEFDIKYDGNPNKVRIIGFKHDKLTENAKTGDYTGQTYAGITFDFVYFMILEMKMNESTTNSGGWAATKMRETLNGYTTTAENQGGSIGGLGAALSNSQYIKQVQKTYGTQYNADTTSTSEDYLWLLSCAEIWSTGCNSTGKGYSMSTEGTQYPWYATNEVFDNKMTNSYTQSNTTFAVKNDSSDTGHVSRLRSSFYESSYSLSYTSFCVIWGNGRCDGTYANSTCGIAPGFCI